MNSNAVYGVLILFFLVVVLFLKIKVRSYRRNKSKGYCLNNNYIYSKKPIMTNTERYFYNIMVTLEKQYNLKIQPQVNLATIISKKNSNYYINELFRNVDFGIFSGDYNDILLLVEINDSTHKQKRRIKRDKNVDDIVNKAGIKLIKFYTNYPNKEEYVIDRILKELNYK